MEGTLGYLLRNVGIKYRYYAYSVLGKDRWGVSQDLAIYPIAQNKKLNQKDLADKLNITPASVSVTVHRMESEGLLIRFPDEKDGRQFNLLLTEKGQKEKTTLILFSIVCSIINIVDAVRKGTHICQENQIECSM